MSVLLSAPTMKRTGPRARGNRVDHLGARKENHLVKVGELATNVVSKVIEPTNAPKGPDRIVGTDGIETEIETETVDDQDQNPEMGPGTAQGTETIAGTHPGTVTIVETIPGIAREETILETENEMNGRAPDETKTTSENSEDKELMTSEAEVCKAKAEPQPDQEVRGVLRVKVHPNILNDPETRTELVLASRQVQVEFGEQPLSPALPPRRNQIDLFANYIWQENVGKVNLAMTGTLEYAEIGTKTKSIRTANLGKIVVCATDLRNHAVDHQTSGPRRMRLLPRARLQEQQREPTRPLAHPGRRPTKAGSQKRNLLAAARRRIRNFQRKAFPVRPQVNDEGGADSQTH
jgi:hypothetical protein